VTLLAFVPMLLTSIGYSELNKADRLRHDIHVGDQGLRPEDGLVRRMGDRRC
jgi:hypothetical protein